MSSLLLVKKDSLRELNRNKPEEFENIFCKDVSAA
jgi:hypothetical protein